MSNLTDEQRASLNRSSISNGKLPFNKRTARGRRLRDLVDDLARAMRAPSSPITHTRVMTAALQQMRIDDMMQEAATGAKIDDTALTALSNSIHKIYTELGIIRDRP